MNSKFASLLISSLACCQWLLAGSLVHADNWPGWRGPRGDGTSLSTEFPLHWDGEEGTGIRWKTAIPGEGHGSPIVWNDRIFLATCLAKQQERVLLCLRRSDGELLWQQTVITCPLETKHALNSRASCTPATDGDLVYVTFLEVDGSTIPAPNVGNARPVTPGRIVVAAYDYSGKQVWITRPGKFISAHGFCSNPVLYEDLVIVNGDHDGDSYLVALDKKTGEVVWKEPRRYKTRSYATPLIRTADGITQMVLCGSKSVASFDPKTGLRLWSVEGPTEQFVASMLFDGTRFIAVGGFPTHHVMAIRPGGLGDVTESHVAWHVRNARCYVPSPVLVDRFLVVADDRGTANCFDAASGKRYWQARLGKHFSASLVAAGDYAFLLADDGQMTIVEPGEDLKVVAENELGEMSFASPAIANDAIFIRGEEHLYCIE